MAASKFRKGQHLVARFRLSEDKHNGDLIAGRIESVRAGGKVHVFNLLTGKHVLKLASVLASRCVVVTQRDALSVAETSRTQGYTAAREHAVTLAHAPPRTCSSALARALESCRALTDKDCATLRRYLAVYERRDALIAASSN